MYKNLIATGGTGKVSTFTPTKAGVMQESKRQKQVAGLLNKELSDIFLRFGLNMVDGGMISISKVTVTPDLYEARIYLSFFQIADPNAMLQRIKDRAWEIKKELTSRVRNQLRSMPQLQFFIDDTLEYVFKMEELFKTIQTPKDDETDKNKDA